LAVPEWKTVDDRVKILFSVCRAPSTVIVAFR
jgi:hypothetical protein